MTHGNDDAASIRRAVMLPGLEDDSEAKMSRDSLDVFDADDSPADAADADAAAQDTSDRGVPRDRDGAQSPTERDDLGDTEDSVTIGPDREHPGRHRSRRRMGRRKPAIVAAAAVGAVLTALPFVSLIGGPERSESEDAFAPTAGVPDDDLGLGPHDGTPGTTGKPVISGQGAKKTAEAQSTASDTPDPGSKEAASHTAPAGHETSGAAATVPPKSTPVTARPTSTAQQPLLPGTVMPATYVFREGQTVVAGGAKLSMERDGNLVVRGSGGVVTWAANTAGLGSRAVFQANGDLEVQDAAGRAVWHTGTDGHPGAKLVLQASGRLVVQAESGAVLWSNTA
ncbi:hypothetical protein ABZ614_11500 [Streptomyces sp. NPDC013178]|uniref:hypothetical protein n=1 Tax=Streptomyces sp. NPDC013178 TaxID=3155118 RepID=UPI0033CCF089